MSKVNGVVCRLTDDPSMAVTFLNSRITNVTARCDSSTPFGSSVEPEVKSAYMNQPGTGRGSGSV